MIYLFEDFSYQSNFLDKVFTIAGEGLRKGIPENFIKMLPSGKSQVKGVGYFFNPGYKPEGAEKYSAEIVYVLPKVFLDAEKDANGKVNGISAFGINVADAKSFDLSHVPKRFLSELALWVCSTIARYRRDKRNAEDYSVSAPTAQGFKKDNAVPSLIDVKNAMEAFYKENESLFVFVSKNKHSGNNKINWQKTISKKTPFLQDDTPIYMELVNKKKVFDLDDRLLVLYFSAMRYIQETFRLDMPKSEFYTPMRVNEFRRLLGHRGLMELRRIKHKYFADKFLKLYNIMVAFFEWGANYRANGFKSEYLLVSRYNNVFQSMIDHLIGVSELPKSQKFLKNQLDGKDVDHLYKDDPLIFSDNDEKIWFIGDSKYYSEKNELSQSDIAKQFTYAKNIVQYNIYNSFAPKDKDSSVRYRDDLTEGYNVTPNFFIRGFLPKAELDDEGKVINTTDKYFRSKDVENSEEGCNEDVVAQNSLFAMDKSNNGYDIVDDEGNKLSGSGSQVNLWELRNRHFENRLFDRDTLLLQVYNVNFLYTAKTYLSKSSGLKAVYREKAHKMFRENFMKLLDEKYVFWAVRPRSGNLLEFVEAHFRLLAGKIFRRNENDDFVILALEKKNPKNNPILDKVRESADFTWLAVEQVVDESEDANSLKVTNGDDGFWDEDYPGFMMKHDVFVEKIMNGTILHKWIKVRFEDGHEESFPLHGGVIPKYSATVYHDIDGYFLPCKDVHSK